MGIREILHVPSQEQEYPTIKIPDRSDARIEEWDYEKRVVAMGDRHLTESGVNTTLQELKEHIEKNDLRVWVTPPLMGKQGTVYKEVRWNVRSPEQYAQEIGKKSHELPGDIVYYYDAIRVTSRMAVDEIVITSKEVEIIPPLLRQQVGVGVVEQAIGNAYRKPATYAETREIF